MMNYKNEPIIFLGTAPFAVGFLEEMVASGYNVSAVVTTPDRPQGRGRRIAPSPVKEFALEAGLPILQPESLLEPKFLELLGNVKPTLGVVVAFRMLPEVVWSLPTLGTINAHASLLPRWRGAAPINHAIRAGDTETGVTLFRLNQQLDEGDIIAQCGVPIREDDNFQTLHDRLATCGRELFADYLPAILQGAVSFSKQLPSESYPYAGKLTRENTRIDWTKPAKEIRNFVRSLSPTPGAWTLLRTSHDDKPAQQFKVFEVEVVEGATRGEKACGSILLPHRGVLEVVAGDGLLRINTIQAPGKKPLPIGDYLNGAKLGEGEAFF